ncbi:MAG: hypothetical protein Q8S22_03655 [Eubacteriales bacterium]|jgi:hypothetical protein|nr:hypothetical protein [Eubacteriales bacterium]
MKFYVASGVLNADKVNQAAAALSAAGHVRTYDWTTHGDVSKADPAFKQHVAASESRGVLEAELIVLLLPGRFGTHAELGMALATATGKRILLWSETSAPFDGTEGFCVFYHHPAVERVVCAFDELLELLTQI